MEEPTEVLCPSAQCKVAARLLGIRQEDGSVAILPEPLLVDDAFIAKVNEGPSPLRRFRFTNRCIESGCAQWTGGGCSVASLVTKYANTVPLDFELPTCAIRPQCRWWLQSGADACKVCTLVITEVVEEEVVAHRSKAGSSI